MSVQAALTVIDLVHLLLKDMKMTHVRIWLLYQINEHLCHLLEKSFIKEAIRDVISTRSINNIFFLFSYRS